MRWPALIMAAAMALAGCGGESKPTPPAQDPSAPSKPATQGEGGMVQRDTSLYFYRLGNTGATTPAFKMTAAESTISADGVATVENATAIIYSSSGNETTIRAAKGTFDNAGQTAVMEGDVVVDIGTMHVELTHLVWVNEERVARSGQPLKITDGEAHMTASGMTFAPDTDTLTLKDVTGKVQLKKESIQ